MPASRDPRPADYHSEGAGFSSSAPVHLSEPSRPARWPLWLAGAVLLAALAVRACV